MADKRKKKADGGILIGFVLDKSGSMDVIRDATISGFNEYKNDQAKRSGTLMSLMMFDTEFVRVCGVVPAAEVADLDYASYAPGGCTALYDAIGHTIKGVDDHIARHGRPGKVLVVIMTDGMENASREYDRQRIFRMIEERQDNRDYEFVYLGANQDAYAVGRSMGVREGRMLNFRPDEDGQVRAFDRLSSATHEVACCMSRSMPSDWLDPDELLRDEPEGAGTGGPKRGRKRPKA